MEAEGLAKFVFYDGGVTNPWSFVCFIMDDQNPSWLVQCEHPKDGIVGLWWLNERQGRTAMVHFCMLGNKGLADKIEIGKQSMHWLSSLDAIDSIYGLTPKAYRNVWPYMDALGFERIGKLQGACEMAYHKGRFIDGVISTLDLGKYKRGEIK
jgi:hypothetical protein